MRKNCNSAWFATKPTSLLITCAENALWQLNRLDKYDRPNSEYYAIKTDEYDFILGQLELRNES